jgi:hypothetical protein
MHRIVPALSARACQTNRAESLGQPREGDIAATTASAQGFQSTSDCFATRDRVNFRRAFFGGVWGINLLAFCVPWSERDEGQFSADHGMEQQFRQCSLNKGGTLHERAGENIVDFQLNHTRRVTNSQNGIYMNERQYLEAQHSLFESLALGSATAAVVPVRKEYASARRA